MSSSVSHARASQRGRTNLPAELRHRWGLEDGGEIAFVDLGESALVLPGGMARAKAEFKSVLTVRYTAGLAAIDDSDLADQ